MELGEIILLLALFGILLMQCPLGVTAGLCPARAMAIRPSEVEDSIHPRDVEDSIHPRDVEDSIHPRDVEDSIRPHDVEDSVRSRDVKDSIRPHEVKDSIYPHDVEGSVRCVCMEQFTGPRCQYRVDQATDNLNISWIPNNNWAIMNWNKDPSSKAQVLLSVRPVTYAMKRISYGKWRQLRVQSLRTATQLPWQHEDVSPQGVAYILPAASTGSVVLALLKLPATASYEVRKTTLGSDNEADHVVSVFLDIPRISKAGYIKDVFVDVKESFNDTDVLKGIAIGSIAGCIGTLILMAIGYALARICVKCKEHRARKVEKQKSSQKTLNESSSREIDPMKVDGAASKGSLTEEDIPTPLPPLPKQPSTTQRLGSSNDVVIQIEDVHPVDNEPVKMKASHGSVVINMTDAATDVVAITTEENNQDAPANDLPTDQSVAPTSEETVIDTPSTVVVGSGPVDANE